MGYQMHIFWWSRLPCELFMKRWRSELSSERWQSIELAVVPMIDEFARLLRVTLPHFIAQLTRLKKTLESHQHAANALLIGLVSASASVAARIAVVHASQ